MKPSAFEYAAPGTIDQAVALLSSSEDAKVLAGGQSLVPAMNLRFATPALLVDINNIPGYDSVTIDGGVAEIGMLVRHARLEAPGFDDPLARLLAMVSHYVGHLPIRIRGTFVGSLAHADPAAEWCAVAAALDARVVAKSRRGERRIAASDFFVGPFMTALEPDELATTVGLPLIAGAGVGFSEISRTAGDFATVAAVAVAWRDGATITDARVALVGVGATPVRARTAEERLAGVEATAATLDAAAIAATEDLDPLEDAYCSRDFRRHLARVMVRRALSQAVEDAG